MPDWRESARARLPEHLDARGDLAPPWAKFPTFERYCIGWRMGSGEGWLNLCSVFFEDLPGDEATRMAYLRRHPPAPICWADWVWSVLFPDAPEADELEDEDEEIAREEAEQAARRAQLLAWGLIEHDVAWRTWRARRAELVWPWRWTETPTEAARYWTRDLWFWSREITERRAQGTLEIPATAPEAWSAFVQALRSGSAEVDAARGLEALALMFAAGEVRPPWALGCSPSEFADSFEMDMGYVDAWRLWGSCFDDEAQVRRFCAMDEAPPEWAEFIETQVLGWF